MSDNLKGSMNTYLYSSLFSSQCLEIKNKVWIMYGICLYVPNKQKNCQRDLMYIFFKYTTIIYTLGYVSY